VPWVIWSQFQESSSSWALVSSRFINGAWLPAEIVTAPVGSNNLFDITCTDGNPWVVDGPDLEQQDIFVGHYENGQWVNRGWLNGGPGLDRDPTITIDNSGRVWVAWVYAGSTPWKVVVSRLSNGQWTSPEVMPLGRVLPELSAVGDTVFLLWRVDDPSNGSNIAYRLWKNGWQAMGFVNEPDTTNTTDTSPSISAFGDRGPVVAWSAGPSLFPDSRDIKFSHWTGSGWSSEETISIPDSIDVANDQNPQVALAPDGQAWVAWERWGPWPHNPDFDIWYASGEVYPPPSTDIWEQVPPLDPISILNASPNPTRGMSTITYVVRQTGSYEIMIADVAGRVVERVPLGLLEPGIYSNDRAFRWPIASRPVSAGVYFVTFRNVNAPRAAAVERLTILR